MSSGPEGTASGSGTAVGKKELFIVLTFFLSVTSAQSCHTLKIQEDVQQHNELRRTVSNHIRSVKIWGGGGASCNNILMTLVLQKTSIKEISSAPCC